AEPHHPEPEMEVRRAEGPAGELEITGHGVAVPTYPIDQLDEVRMREGLVPDEAERERARGRLEHVVRRVDDDGGRLERVDDLLGARGDHGAHDGDGPLAAP